MDQNKLTPAQAYQFGDIVEYKIKALFNNYCELIDEKTEISAYLQGTAKLVLFKGQTVKCRVIAVSEKHPKIELVNISEFEQGNDNLTEEKLTKILESRDISWSTKDFVKLLLTEEKEKSYESQCHRWIQTLLNKKIDLQIVRRDCSDVLELSDFLNICSNNERDFYQERLTLLIEQLGYYIRAAELIDNEANEESKDTPDLFVDNILNKPSVSGFVYHPNKNFNILSCLFLRKPGLMDSRIKELLDIISKKDLEIWEREPFSSALIKLLELYIRECDGRFDKIKDNKELIDNNLLALAIQLLLIKDSNVSGIADYHLNAARLCILSSYLYPLNSEKFINAAYSILFNSDVKLPPYTIEDIKVLPHFISGSQFNSIDTVNSFPQGNGRLQISAEGIQLQSAGVKSSLRPVFPSDLGLWNNLQVMLPSKTETNLSSVKSNDIAPYQFVWTEIESEFFNASKKPVIAAKKSQKVHRVYDTVNITFTAQDEINKNKYYCQIEDEIGGNGFIYVNNDIVGYPIITSLRHFYASDGSRYVFQAQIVEVVDDMFHFSMFDDLKNFFMNEYYSYDEDIICSVGNKPNVFGNAPAITAEGISASIRNAGDFEGIERNSIVKCRLTGSGSDSFHISCDIVDYIPSGSFDFDLYTAFKNLVEDSSVGKIPESISDQEEDQILESDKLIDETYVRGLISMIDRLASIDKDYVKSYNYLGFARIFSLLIGWESQATYYKGRMDIIVMLHDFAQKNQVDKERLTQLENANADLFSSNVILGERFKQLQTVSFIGNEEHNQDLFELATSNPSLKSLASLVLAYNITKSSGLESSATNIHNKIIQLLDLKGYETGLKLYGTGEETEEVEYKTSIVFCADDSNSMPNQEKQMDEILKVINSFLNTRGGTLYIGVNNFGYGVGVEEDLNNSLYYGDKDKYIRTIVDAVALEWGNHVATTYIEGICFDKENEEKDILIVSILPIKEGVAYHGSWYVRKAGSKRRLSQSEFEEYQNVSRRLQALPVTDKEEKSAEAPSEVGIAAISKSLVSSKDDEIKTSRIRKNILNDWEDGYEIPIGFFKFISGGKFKRLDSYDYDEESLLTLVVKDEEQGGYLVLGYENGHIVKVPVDELMKYKNQEYSRSIESKLIFASVAKKDDAILTISKEDKSKPRTMMRLDKLSNFEEGKLLDGGQLPYNEGMMDKILAYDVIPHEAIGDFKGILDRPKNSLGHTNNAVVVGMVNKLHLWGIKEI